MCLSHFQCRENILFVYLKNTPRRTYVWIKSETYRENKLLHFSAQIDQMQLGLPSREYFLHKDSDRDLEAYHNYMTDVAVILGAPRQNASNQLWEVIQFEKLLANVSELS